MTRSSFLIVLLLTGLPGGFGACSRQQSETPRSSAAGVEAWTAQLQDADWKRRVDAAQKLGASGHADAIAPLSAAVADSDLRVRLAVVDACGAHRSPKLIAAVHKALADPSKELRRRAIRALAKIGSKEAGEAMIGSLDGASMWLRPTVALGLASLPPKVLSDLALGKKVILAELAALRALGKPGLKRAHVLLGRLAKRRHGKFVEAAARAFRGEATNIREEGAIGIAECDAFIKAFRCYVSKLPAAAAGPARAAFQKTIAAWRTASSGPAKSTLAKGCKMAIDAFRKSTRKIPTFKACFP